MQWSGLQSLLEHAESDALILLDCCAAASSISAAGSGVTEVIAACGFETWAPGVGEHSFTRSLIDELRYWGQGNPLSVAMLHNKVLSRIKYWKPRFGKNGADNEQRKTPIYVVIADEGKQRSIVLTPFPPAESSAVELAAAPLSSSSASDASMDSQKSNHDIPQDSSQSSLDQIWPDVEFRNPKFLISIALEEDQWLSPTHWIEWLRSVPALARYAHVEGLYKSGSSLILLSVPVAIWDLLPKSPAFMFISFTHSSNLLRDTPTTWVPSTEDVKISGGLGKISTDDIDSQSEQSRNIKQETPFHETYRTPAVRKSSKPLNLEGGRVASDSLSQNFRQKNVQSQTASKNLDIEDWLERLEPQVASVDAPPGKPGDRSRQRPRQQTNPLSFTNIEQLNTNDQQVDLIPGPGVLIDEESGDDEETSSNSTASIEDSPPPETMSGELSYPISLVAKPGVYEEHHRQPILYRAKLWQDHLYDSSDPGVIMQPRCSSDAILQYQQRAEDIETASCAATWGTRCLSDSDLTETFNRFYSGDHPRQNKEPLLQGLSARLASRTAYKELERSADDKSTLLKQAPFSPFPQYSMKGGNADRTESSSVAGTPSSKFDFEWFSAQSRRSRNTNNLGVDEHTFEMGEGINDDFTLEHASPDMNPPAPHMLPVPKLEPFEEESFSESSPEPEEQSLTQEPAQVQNRKGGRKPV